MKLTSEQMQSLSWLSRQSDLVWCGVYARGGDPTVAALEAAGYIVGIEQEVVRGKASFPGGYRITDAGRAALTPHIAV